MSYLAQHLMGNPQLMARLVVAYQQQRELDDQALIRELGIDEYGLARLVLCKRPRPEHMEQDLAGICEQVGCAEEPLWAMLQAVAGLLETRQPEGERA
jgi:hypothetical protein